MRSLAAHHDPGTLQTLRSLLRTRGHEVATASSAWGARSALLAPDAPQLAVLDTDTAGANGVALCLEMRCRLARPYTYTVLLIPPGQGDRLIAGMVAGADECLAGLSDADALRIRLRALSLQ